MTALRVASLVVDASRLTFESINHLVDITTGKLDKSQPICGKVAVKRGTSPQCRKDAARPWFIGRMYICMDRRTTKEVKRRQNASRGVPSCRIQRWQTQVKWVDSKRTSLASRQQLISLI